MKKPVYPVKISLPIVTAALPRKRLFRLLERTCNCPLVWVGGPAGSGKTTLMAGYVEASNTPCLWYQCDQGDSDPATFFYHMGQAARKAAPRFRKPLPLLTPEYYQGITTFAVRYFESLFARLNPPALLVFDNYQEVAFDSLLHKLLAEALNRIPSGFRIVLVSRTAPLPEFSRFLANQKMTLIEWDDLRFNLTESQRVVRLWVKGRFPSAAVEQMHRLTQGWVAGLVLLAQHTGTREARPQFLMDQPPEEIFGYFASEVFEKLDAGTRLFLMQTAFLPSFTTDMAEALTDAPHTRRLLAELARRNQFTERRQQPGITYQYHPLFRAFLQNQATGNLGFDEIKALHSESARLLEQAGQIEDAVEAYRKAGDWPGVARIILTKAQELIVHGRNQGLLNWLGSLPQDFLDASPWLLYWKGVALLPFDPVRARGWCEQAYALFRASRDATGLFLSWSAIVDSIFLFERDRAGPLDRWIEELEQLLQEFPQMPSPEVDARVALSMFSTLVWYRPSHPSAGIWEKKNLALLHHCTDPDQRIMIGNWLALFYLYNGDTAKMAMVLEVLHPLSRHATIAPFTRIVMLILESYLHHVRGEREACLKAIEKGKETATTSGVHALDFFLFASGLNISLACGDLDSARNNLENIAAVLNWKSHNDVGHYYYLAAFEALVRRDTPLARQHLETSLMQILESGTEHHLALCRLAFAHVLLEMGDRDKAELQLAQAMRFNQGMKSRLLEFLCLQVQALLAIRSGLVDESREHLARAFRLGREEAVMSPHWQVPAMLAELCAHALEAGIEEDYVQGLVMKWELFRHFAPTDCEKWPWPVKINCLSGFSVIRKGEVLEFPVKAQKKPLEMLKVLISAGESGITEEQVSDILWPDAAGDRAHQSFATTLHRLRKLLHIDETLRLRDGRLNLEPRYFWVDAWTFERFAKEADAALRGGEQARGLRSCEKAFNLYRGRFLGGDSGEPWADAYSNRLQSKFLRCVEAIGKHLEQSGQWEQAEQHYRKGLEADALAESLHQRLMHCLGTMGRRAEMLAAYERCRKTLREHLDIDPNPETEALRTSHLTETTHSKPPRLRPL